MKKFIGKIHCFFGVHANLEKFEIKEISIYDRYIYFCPRCKKILHIAYQPKIQNCMCSFYPPKVIFKKGEEMREIKFRGFNLARKEWIYGYLIHNPEGFFIYEEKTERLIRVDFNSIGQFIGHKDHNGKEIYERDFIEVNKGQNNEIIEWKEEDLGHDGGLWIGFSWGWSCLMEECEIIGNSYENPELLKTVLGKN